MTSKNELGRSFLVLALTKTHPGGTWRYATAAGGTRTLELLKVLSKYTNAYQHEWANFNHTAEGLLT